MIAVVLVLAAVVSSRPDEPDTGPLAVSAVSAPGAASAECAALVAALPDPLGGLPRRQLADPDGAGGLGVAAWSDPPVVLRCGLPTPAELTCSAALQVVDSVAWLPIQGDGATTYLAVDRPVRIALTVPDGTGTGPWQGLSKIVAGTVPVRDVCDQGVVVPVEGD